MSSPSVPRFHAFARAFSAWTIRRSGRSAGAPGRCRPLLVLLAAALLPLAACGRAPAGQPATAPATAAISPLGGNLITLRFKSASGAETDLHVRVEANDPDRERGLMNVAKLPEDEGDLFAWPDIAPNRDVLAPFWMKDTLIPLSIAFISADGRVQEVQDMQPETETYHVPSQLYRYAVEANQGWYSAHGLGPGATVNLPAALAPLNLPTGTPPANVAP